MGPVESGSTGPVWHCIVRAPLFPTRRKAGALAARDAARQASHMHANRPNGSTLHEGGPGTKPGTPPWRVVTPPAHAGWRSTDLTEEQKRVCTFHSGTGRWGRYHSKYQCTAKTLGTMYSRRSWIDICPARPQEFESMYITNGAPATLSWREAILQTLQDS